MQFGKVENVSQIDFSLYPEPVQCDEVFTRMPARVQSPRIYVGATGYNMKAWAGKWYPAKAKDRDFLRHYGQQFNTIEHNTTHYRIPDSDTVTRWRTEVPADFRFCPKVPQSISHAADLGLGEQQIEYFCTQIAGLGNQLGHCFLQLPPHFDVQDVPLLERFLDRWDAQVPLAVEVRHTSFFEGTKAAERYFQMLEARGLPAVITDVAGRRDVCHMRITSQVTMIRFVGNELHATDYSRMEAWGKVLARWFEQGLHTAYIFTHEPDNILAPDLAAFAVKTLQTAVPNASIRGPKMVETLVQGSLF